MSRISRPALAALAVAASFTVAPAAPAVAAPATRAVMVVSNNWAGTADLVDPVSFKRLKRLDVIPDKEVRIRQIEADPQAKLAYENVRRLVGEGHDQYVDDGFTSPDGRTVYFSRPSFADAVAIDLRTGRIRWRTKIDGFRADHMAISASGRRLLVSASGARTIDVLDTRTGRIVGRIPAGDQPHENTYSRDGRRIYNASIGVVVTAADDPSQDATKGERIFEVIDARTNKVLKRIDMGEKLAEAGHPGMSSAVRPMTITPDERFVFFQVSFFFGIVKYDLRADKVVAVLKLPLGAAAGVDRTEFLLDSAHHGLAMNPAGTKLCVAGTMSGYGAIVSMRPFRLERITPVGRVPYWSAATPDGKHCFVSVAGDDRVAVLSYATGREVASIRVGDHPQRMRAGVIRSGYLVAARHRTPPA